MNRRLLLCTPFLFLGLLDQGKPQLGNEATVTIDGKNDDEFYVNVSYRECEPGDRALQYFFLSSTVDMKKYWSARNSRIVMGGYQFSKLKYTHHEYKNGKWTIHFRKDRAAGKIYEDLVKKMNKDARALPEEWGAREQPEVSLSNDMQIFVRQYSIGKPERVLKWKLKV